MQGDVLTDIERPNSAPERANRGRTTLDLIGSRGPVGPRGSCGGVPDMSCRSSSEKPSSDEIRHSSGQTPGAYIIEREVLAEMAPADRGSRSGARTISGARHRGMSAYAASGVLAFDRHPAELSPGDVRNSRGGGAQRGGDGACRKPAGTRARISTMRRRGGGRFHGTAANRGGIGAASGPIIGARSV